MNTINYEHLDKVGKALMELKDVYMTSPSGLYTRLAEMTGLARHDAKLALYVLAWGGKLNETVKPLQMLVKRWTDEATA